MLFRGLELEARLLKLRVDESEVVKVRLVDEGGVVKNLRLAASSRKVLGCIPMRSSKSPIL